MNNRPPDNIQRSRRRPKATEAELRELRSLLLGPDVEARLKDSEVRSEDVSRVLPEAIILSSRKDEEQLTTAVVPTVEEAIKNSVHQDQYVLSEALFPIIGPATRKAVTVALQDFTQTLNQGLDQSFSPKSLKWRFEAWRTGQSFAEIVILHTLIYRVEQVFLIHKETGLLLQHVVEHQATVQDPELVSAMLTAIKDFVRDSFAVETGETLDTLHFGELTIWIEDGPSAVIAGVVRGTAPTDIRLVFQHNLEKIHLVLGQSLEDFSGDNSPFNESQPYLQDCLQGQFKTERKSIPPLAFILIPLVCILGYWAFTTWHDRQQWATYVSRLRLRPGVVVQKNYIKNGRYYLYGMRDWETMNPAKDSTLFDDLSLDPERIQYFWEPYHSLHHELVTDRAKQKLKPPVNAELKVDEESRLIATGLASKDWHDLVLREGNKIEGVRETNVDDLELLEAKVIQQIKRKIEGITLLFPTGKNRLSFEEKEDLEALAKNSLELIQLADKIDQNVTIYINGYADSTGTERRNITLSQARASFIQDHLILNNIPRKYLKTRALGDRSASQDREQSLEPDPTQRKVTLQVDIQG